MATSTSSTFLLWQIILPIFLIIFCSNDFHMNFAGADPVFITTADLPSHPKRSAVKKMDSNVVISAADAALAMNSVQFMEMLTDIKNSADVKTYTQMPQNVQSAKKDLPSSTLTDPKPKHGFPPLKFVSRIFGTSNNFSDGNQNKVSLTDVYDCSAEDSNDSDRRQVKSLCPTHETVSEYIGRLWFLPNNKGGIKFREIVRVSQISSDGNSSTVECNTQYFNGSQWIDCATVICRFSSVIPVTIEIEKDPLLLRKGNVNVPKIEMALDCKLLVWLPFPKAVTNAVKEKISSVFENVALNFFDGLATV